MRKNTYRRFIMYVREPERDALYDQPIQEVAKFMTKDYYAHTLPDQPPSQWERLEDHLRRVAEGDDETFVGARGFAEALRAGEWGRVLGWWHDVGKYSEAFQGYLKRVGSEGGDIHVAELKGTVDHATAGAQHAAQHCSVAGRLMAYALAGHHTGLLDTSDGSGGTKGLDDRLKKKIDESWEIAAPAHVKEQPCPALPQFNWAPNSESERQAFQVAMFGRMLFSCLVDADFLATEWIMRRDKASLRPVAPPTMSALRARLDDYLLSLRNEPGEVSAVNQKRREVLEACRTKAMQPPGLFSLTVPTGGGKTLSSLAFALTHAERHGLRRVIYAAPFTSIIEQNAEVFRQALGDLSQWVLEHHSNLEPNDPEKQSERSRLAAENWDSPLIVTTNVQFFESLFACRTSRCRKLHRIAGSVIVLDEAQTLPVELLTPTLAAIEELTRNYGCTIVLCTATQPAIEHRQDFDIGLTHVQPIIDRPRELYEALKRVEVQAVGRLDDETLADRLADESQVLCIINTRDHATNLFRMVCQRLDSDVGCFHLSARMCPAHRSDVLKAINAALKARKPCRVVSTQLIEAGVDVDFPCVYRAMAGLDSIAQAAGRCNREGRLTDQANRPQYGRVYVFDTDVEPQYLKQTVDAARQVLPDHPKDLLSLAAMERYFQLHYWQQSGNGRVGWDTPQVMRCFGNHGNYLQYREAAEKYRFIQDAQTPVIVPYGKHGDQLVRELMAMSEPPGRGFDRCAQRYVVGLYDRDIAQLRANAALLEHHDRFVLGNRDAYDSRVGLRMDVAGLDERHFIV